MEFKQAKDLVRRLKAPKIERQGELTTRMPTLLELEAAGMIDSLVFQLESRVAVEEVKKAAPGLEPGNGGVNAGKPLEATAQPPDPSTGAAP